MKTVFIIILSLLLALSIGYNFLGDGNDSSSEMNADSGAGKQLYTCGMHPNVVLDHPGICPICEMKLTPMKMDNQSSDNAVRIDPATQQNIGVRTAAVTRQNLYREIRTNGKVLADENRTYIISPKISGWIDVLNVSETGQEVSKGEPLFKLYSPELVAAQEEYLLALKSRDAIVNVSNSPLTESSNALLDAARDRLLNWDFSADQLEQLAERGTPERLVTFYSPARGIVTHKGAVEGDFQKAGSQPFHIADLSSIWVEAEVYEYELPWVSVGQEAILTSSYDPELEIRSHVTFIYPYLNPSTRTAKIRISAANPMLELKPEMYVDVALKSRAVANALAVPREAVLRSGKRDVVFVAKGKGEFEPREVKLGLESDASLYEIQSGLSEGEQVVTSAQFLLGSEVQLQEALNRLLAGGGSATDIHAAMGHTGHGQSKEMEHAGDMAPEASGRTMEALYESDDLYQCPEHHQIITAEAGTVCPLGGKELAKMSSAAIEELRDSDPYGCVMCPIIRPGAEQDTRCEICNMQLKPVPHN